MSVVDRRVVEMEFDNATFENDINSSLSALDKFKMGLQNLANMGQVAANGIGGFVSKLVGMPNTLIGITTQVEILNKAFNYVFGTVSKLKATIDSLTFDQIDSGWQQYADKVSAVQTIMTSTQGEMDEVNKEVERLSWFSDETSFSLTNMTKALSGFTAQGVELKDAVTYVEGISLWGSSAGKNANQVASAMTQIQQAFGSGKFQNIDWQSIETLGMNTYEFMTRAMETAATMVDENDKAINTLIKKNDKYYVETSKGLEEVTTANFRSMLQYNNWFNREVMKRLFTDYGVYADEIYKISGEYETATKAMEAFDAEGDHATDTLLDLGRRAFKAGQEAKTFKEVIEATQVGISSRWMQVFEAIFGNYEEARDLWSEMAENMYDVFVEPIDALSGIFKQWKDLNGGGRDTLLRAWSNAWDTLFIAVDKVKGVLEQVFPKFDENTLALFVKQINYASYWVKDLVSNFEISQPYIDAFAHLFQGLQAVFRTFKHIIGQIIDVIPDLVTGLSPVGDVFLWIINKVADLLIWFEKFEKANNFVAITLDFITTVVSKLAEGFKTLLTTLKDLAVKLLPKDFTLFGVSVFDASSAIEFLGDVITNVFSAVAIGVNLLGTVLGTFGTYLKLTFSVLFDTIKGYIPLIGQAFSSIGEWIVKAIQYFDKMLAELADSDNPFKKAEALINSLSKAFSALIQLFIGTNFIGILVAIKKLISGEIDWGKILETVLKFTPVAREAKSISRTLQDLPENIAGIFRTLKSSITGMVKATIIKSYAQAFLMLAGSLAILAILPWDKLLYGSLVVLPEMAAALIVMEKIVKRISESPTFNAKNFIVIADTFLAFGAAIMMMAFGVSMIANAARDEEQLNAAMYVFLTISGIMTLFVVAMQEMNNLNTGAARNMMALSFSLVAFAGAIAVIAPALVLISMVPVEKMWNAVGALGAITGGLIALIMIMATFGNASTMKAGNYMAMAGALVLIAGAIVAIAIAAGLLALIPADKLLQASLSIVGIMTAFALILAVVAVFADKVAIGEGVLLAIAGTIFIIAFSINMFADALTKIATVLGVLATVFTIFSAFDDSLAQKFSDFIDMMIEKIPLIINAFLTAIAEAPVEIIFDIINKIFEFIMVSFETWIPRYVQSVINMGQNLGQVIASFITQFDKGDGMGKLTTIVSKVLDYTIEIIEKSQEKIKTIAEKIIRNIIDVVKRVTPEIIPYLKDTFAMILIALTEKMPEIWEFIKEFIKESLFKLHDLIILLIPNILQLVFNVIDGLIQHIPDILVQSITVIGALLGTLIRMVVELFVSMARYIWDACIEAMDKIIALLDEYKDPLINKLVEFLTALTDFLTSDRMDPLIDAIAAFIEAIADFLGSDKMDPIFDAVEDLIDKLVDLIAKVITRSDAKMIESGANLIKGLIIGINKEVKNVLGVCWSAGKDILKSFHDSTKQGSPSKATIEMGGYLMEGLSIGIKDGLSSTLTTVNKSGTSVLDTLRDTLSGVGDYIDGNMEMNPTITPVLDLSNVRSNIGSLSSMFGTQQVNAIATGGGFTNGSMMGTDINTMSNMMQKLNDKLDDLHVTTNATPVEVNVNLEGDTNKLFKAMVDKNNNRIRATGYNQFTRQKG